jgi:hypothetical protein
MVEPNKQRCDYWTDTVQGSLSQRWYCTQPAGHSGYHDMSQTKPSGASDTNVETRR